MEVRDISINDTNRAFCYTGMEWTVRARLDIFSEILLKIDPEKYGDKVVIKRGKKFVYAVLKRLFYGALISSLLLWIDLVRNMKPWILEYKPYETCFINKVVDENYYTVCWHVGYIKISHVESTVANDILRRLD